MSEQEFISFYASVQGKLMALVRRFNRAAGWDGEAEDIVQDALVTLWQLSKGGYPIRDAEALAVKITKTCCVERYRRQHIRFEPIGDRPFTGSDAATEGTEKMDLETIDKNVLGHFRDGVDWVDGQYVFKDYHYTWILSSMNFAVTAMLGCFTGMALRKQDWAPMKKVRNLLICGALMIVAALLLDPVLPIIKHIWSSSMTLLSGGISIMAMAVTYYLVDVKKFNKGLDWLKYYGMNAIVAYCVYHLVNFSSIPTSLLHGTSHLIGSWYPFLISFCCLLIQFLILRYLYRHKIFIRV